MKSDSTTVIKNMEFLVKELHKEWDRSGASKASVIISLEEVDGINNKLKEIIYQQGGVFTKDFIEAFINIKRKEVERLNMTPHPVEFEMYYA